MSEGEFQKKIASYKQWFTENTHNVPFTDGERQVHIYNGINKTHLLAWLDEAKAGFPIPFDLLASNGKCIWDSPDPTFKLEVFAWFFKWFGFGAKAKPVKAHPIKILRSVMTDRHTCLLKLNTGSKKSKKAKPFMVDRGKCNVCGIVDDCKYFHCKDGNNLVICDNCLR